jgi:signal transduction histidine kinase/ligand-binding sensor domain-containing protein/DNA-binding response OmpR family regulator
MNRICSKRFLFQAFIFCFVSFLFFQKAESSEYKFRHLNSSNGLSSNHITAIHKDRSGFVWFGTISGLNRYDGYSFKVYKNIPGDTTTIPFNDIQTIYEDHRGCLWILSQDNLLTVFDPRKDIFYRNYDLLGGKDGIPSDFISGVVIDRDSNLWVSSNQYGIYKVTASTGRIQRFHAAPKNSFSVQSDLVTDVLLAADSSVMTINAYGVVEKLDAETGNVDLRYQLRGLSDISEPGYFSAYADEDGDLWIYSVMSDKGLFFYDIETGKELHFSVKSSRFKLSSDIVTGVVQDREGYIWVGTDHGGLQIINKKDFSVQTVLKMDGISNGLTQNSITSLMRDDSGTVWVGTYKEGVNFFHSDLFQFKLFTHNPLTKGGLPANDIDCFAEDNKGNLYIGTNGNGLIYYDRKKSAYKVYSASPVNADSLSHDVIVSLLYDSKNRLWVGTYYGGLNCWDGKKFKRYYHNSGDPSTIADNKIWKIFEDSAGRIWVGTLGGGLDLWDEQNDGFLHYRDGDLNSVNSNFILTMNEDNAGNLWLGTSFGVDVLSKNTGRFSHIPANPGKRNALSHHIVSSIIQDQRGLMWFGTRNGLNMYNSVTKEFKLFLERDGLPDNNILNLLEDAAGNIWMSTLNGLSRLEVTETDSGYACSFCNFDLLDGLQGREFNEHSAFKTSKGELIFGGPDGFNLFQPGGIHKSPYSPKVFFTGLRLFNKDVQVGEVINKRIILKEPLFLSDTLVLKHNQNVFSFEFAGMGCLHPEKIKYQYKLDGFNDQWVSTDASNRLATYTNLNHGIYRFRVRARSGENGIMGKETSLIVIVKPPFYATPFALVCYVVIFTALVIAFGFIIRRREEIKYERQHELNEHKRIHEMDAMKIKFFTNISHEFRTPLTLIITPLEKLMHDVGDKSIQGQLKIVVRNAKRMLGLVNQLLDFRKIEVKGLVLHRSKDDIVEFVKDVAVSFSELFETRRIRFTVTSNVSSLLVAFDRDKLEKIIFNLLSNAFKYSHEDGAVKLVLDYLKQGSDKGSVKGPVARIMVIDNGIGVSKETQTRIFDRFFQVDTEVVPNMGSGIGLAITREFVHLHGGEIFVDSRPGEGSVFTVDLPAVSEEDSGVSAPLSLDLTATPSGETAPGKNGKDEKPILLIIEDNDDLRVYLKKSLENEFRIVEAANGDDGLVKATSVFPDVIISDIIMPGKDGIELCRQLKTDNRTSHIPVILLTAKVAAEQQVEGLVAGAEDYITKPFNYEVLELKIRKQIELREKLRDKLHKQHYEITPGEIGVTSLDEKFIKKATTFVEKNISNTGLSVELFSREMGVSRGHLYNKIVALTGKTPSEFIRIMRLKRGAQLLGKSQLTIGEIAYKVGFNDPKYFSRYFREEFGIYPSEYAHRIVRNEGV